MRSMSEDEIEADLDSQSGLKEVGIIWVNDQGREVKFGPFKIFDKNNILRLEGFYLMGGKRHGAFNFYDEKGHPYLSGFYTNGKRNGRFIYYYEGEGSQIEAIMYYQNDVLHGTYETFNEHGQKRSYQEFIQGINHGKYTSWYDDGAYECEGQFHMGTLDGEWMFHIKNQPGLVNSYQTKQLYSKGTLVPN
jgi:antitoxin component YwqK of YwqJK toxin-antitoxin module